MPSPRTDILIALGGNLPDPEGSPEANLVRAVAGMAAAGLELRAVSRFYRTPCFPAGAGPDFVNAAVAVRGGGDPAGMLAVLHAIEAGMGRVRTQRWQERPIDLDLIAAGDLVLPDAATHRHWRDLGLADQARLAPDRLILPHPRLADRAFVLAPLADIAPGWVHPATGRSVVQMLDDLPDAARADIHPL